jgi:hypothetical protein
MADFALFTALYRSSIDGRKFQFETIQDDEKFDIPAKFTSRTAEILQVYFKSLGIRMKTVYDEDEFIGEPEHDTEIVQYDLNNNVTLFCTPNEMYYLKKLNKIYKRYLKETPNTLYDINEIWDYVIKNITFKKKYLTDNIINLFKTHLGNIP